MQAKKRNVRIKISLSRIKMNVCKQGLWLQVWEKYPYKYKFGFQCCKYLEGFAVIRNIIAAFVYN